ncbi:hypothetical protein [Chitinibacter tainanensis]|nr:hypothetical protein [Chitinibacter tainanensis]
MLLICQHCLLVWRVGAVINIRNRMGKGKIGLRRCDLENTAH